MYLNFYGFREKPFNPTPDPRFLYLSPSHREALAQLEYAVRERRGFLVLTGEVGTGKTTLLQTLLTRLKATTETAYVFNSKMPFPEILEYVLEDLGIPAADLSHPQRIAALNRYLVERHRENLDTVLIIDEAQNLGPDDLEQVRLLSNFETPTAKLLQILLVGQPELHEKLLLPELRQLRQRLSLRVRIGPLSRPEVQDYVAHRLRVARAPFHLAVSSDIAPFTKDALDLVARHSGGNPRLINLLCDHSLLSGYAEQQHTIDRKTIQETIDYLEEGERPPETPSDPPPARSRLRWSLGGALALAVLGTVTLTSNGMDVVSEVFSSVVAALSEFVSSK